MAEEKPVTVLLAVDRSKQAEEAFHWYAEIIHQPSYKVVLVHIPESPTVKSSEGMHLPAGEWQKMRDTEEKETSEMIAKYTQLMKETGILNVEYKTKHGHKPGEALVQAAEETGATFIVMGTRGMGTLRRTVMGSVSSYVLHHAKVPVIICRSHPK